MYGPVQAVSSMAAFGTKPMTNFSILQIYDLNYFFFFLKISVHSDSKTHAILICPVDLQTVQKRYSVCSSYKKIIICKLQTDIQL